MVQLTIKYDSLHDAQCFVNFVLDIKEKFRYGRQPIDLEKKLRPILLPAYHSFTPLTSQEEKVKAFNKILSDPTQNDFDEIQKMADSTIFAWNEYGHKMIDFLEKLYQKKFPFDYLTGLIETNGYCGYSSDLALVGILFKARMSRKFFCLLHELNHFMFHFCYGHLLPVLGEIRWHILKEAMITFSNPNSKGYPACQQIHSLFRANFRNYWKNLDQAVNAALPLLYQ